MRANGVLRHQSSSCTCICLGVLQKYGELLALSWAVNLLESDAQARLTVFKAWAPLDKPSLHLQLSSLLTDSQLWRLMSQVRPAHIASWLSWLPADSTLHGCDR